MPRKEAKQAVTKPEPQEIEDPSDSSIEWGEDPDFTEWDAEQVRWKKANFDAETNDGLDAETLNVPRAILVKPKEQRAKIQKAKRRLFAKPKEEEVDDDEWEDMDEEQDQDLSYTSARKRANSRKMTRASTQYVKQGNSDGWPQRAQQNSWPIKAYKWFPITHSLRWKLEIVECPANGALYANLEKWDLEARELKGKLKGLIRLDLIGDMAKFVEDWLP